MQIDRWIEIDLFFFQEQPFEAKACEFIERFAPLYRDVDGDRGVILCCGWICDLITEWKGEPGQGLPFRSPSSGQWSRRTYADLQELIRVLKSEADKAGLPGFKVGLMVVGWGTFNWGAGYFYDMDSGWFERHPEIYFPDNWKNPDFRKRLKKDNYPYASLPQGIPEGLSYGEFFAGQWKLASHYLGFDAIMLRDGFLGPCIYEINGPFGTKGPENPEEAAEWSRELLAFFTAVKQANPETIVMVYSSARSAVAEYRTGCFDLEALVAAEAVDVWVDQTWAGAWQDWWSQELRGWTFQLANLLVHHAMIAAGNAKRKVPCRHFHLIETWDAWEPWDTLHQVPGKLRWGMWAFSHVAVHTKNGLSRIAGSYIGWANNWEGRLLSTEDVNFVGKNLDAAFASAQNLEEVYGPVLALNKPQMAALQGSSPAANAGDLVDDHCAMLMKWGFPCLSAANVDALPPAKEGYLLQTPAALSTDLLGRLRQPETAYIAVGGGDFIANEILEDVGIGATDQRFPWGKQHLLPPDLVPDESPKISAVNLAPTRRFEPAGAQVVAQTTKTLLMARSAKGAKFVWQPQHPYTPGSSVLRQHMFGSLAPFVALARAYQRAMHEAGHSAMHPTPYFQPAAFHYWRSGGRIFVLVGNLETGIAGDSRNPREVTIVLRKAHLRLGASARHVLQETDEKTILNPEAENEAEIIFRIPIAPLGSGVYQLLPSH